MIVTPMLLFFFCHLLSASAVDDLQMKELQDQLEAETYFSVGYKFWYSYLAT